MDINPFQHEKLSIKNLLFTKAIPNYILPIPTDGRPVFACTDCGDKFIIKSSYEYHITRKSLQITYFCRHCNVGKIFFNRCDLLSHIRSHAFKTATISISDLKIEPLPLSYYNDQSQKNCDNEAPLQLPLSTSIQDVSEGQNEKQLATCFDCKQNFFCSGIIHRDRAKHYTQYTNILYSCPICLLTLTTKCALEAHLRIHIKLPPYYCPDCGINLTKKAIVYPYTHDCESFKMMRATAKLRCSVDKCNKIFHPSESYKHLKNNHLRHVYKCPACSVACYKLDNMQKHLKSLHMGKLKQSDLRKYKHIDFLQCEMCPGRLVIPGQINKHLKSHENNYIKSVYPCWTCGAIYTVAKALLVHQQLKHPGIYIKKIFRKVSQESNLPNLQSLKTKLLGRPSVKCVKCYKNSILEQSSGHSNILCTCKSDSIPTIVCNLCKVKITLDWNVIKKHYAIYHKEHVCLDAKILLKKICINNVKNCSEKRKKVKHIEHVSYNVNNCYIASENSSNLNVSLENNKFVCRKCSQSYENKLSLERHIVEHRDPFMAYQCLECGESFIAKPSFATHLLLKHGENDVNSYIEEKKCYNKDSVHLQKPINVDNGDENEPVKENQCGICREQFCNSTDFQKHFRMHGMAFLMKNTSKPTSQKHN